MLVLGSSGVGEIVLLPLDVLKIKAQTNPESLKGRGVISIFAEEGMALYKCVSHLGEGLVWRHPLAPLWFLRFLSVRACVSADPE